MSWKQPISALGLAAVGLLWAAFLAVAMVRTGFAWLPALLSLGMLFVVPLGLAASGACSGMPLRGWGIAGVVLAAVLASASFVFESTVANVLLLLSWLLTVLLLAGEALLQFRSWHKRRLSGWAFLIARLNLCLAGLWLAASRLGYAPMGFREPIVLLTAVHFTFSGFGVATLTGVTLSGTSGQVGTAASALRRLAPFLILLPYAVAIGFVVSPLLKLCAASLLAVAVLGLCGMEIVLSAQFKHKWARALLRASAACGIFAMLLVIPYALGDYLHANWLSIPAMIRTHGLVNGPGFLLLALFGWLLEVKFRKGTETSQ
jgi:hypothetical protein